MELVMWQNFLSHEDVEQRFKDFTSTETYQTMEKEKGKLPKPNFSNSIGVDLFFYDEETVQSANVEDIEEVPTTKEGYFIVTNLSDDMLLKAAYIYDSDNDTKVEISNLKNLLIEDDGNIIKIDSFLNGIKKDSFSKDTSASELKPDPETFQKQPEGTKGTVFNKNRTLVSFPCAGECCTFGGVNYQHCGSNCGVRGDYGGGDLQNQLDGCCFMHDNCYHEGKGFCECDTDLIDCANSASGPGSNTIIAFFLAKTTPCTIV
ncbi:hypothetical protein [Lentibacillus salicampi]|uniref:Phospholipase n=1 Tax=Lentibacillus salicampi TaxID=175306 RepID=A0A4Y9ADL7_9BACI|nr:hypothetical protein [Lentibacillus salicampi]TFJ93040.1 hypothetical protein E4U82_09435 [Lentibacillus salicampi]